MGQAQTRMEKAKDEGGKNTVTVSVVISTYNRPDSLKRAIDSVLKQTYQDFEIIVVHDEKPSLDDKPEDTYIVPIEGGRAKHVYIPHFGNDTRPKNKGILESKGKYIAFLDDDNQYRPDYLQVLVKELDNNPQLDVAYGDRFVYQDGKPMGPGVFHDYKPGLLMERNYIDTSDVLVRKEALLSVGGFDERYDKYIDWNLWLRMEKARKTFKRVPLVITDYNLSSDSKSVKKLTKAERDFQQKTGQFRNIPDWSPVDLEIELPYLGEVRKPRVAIFSLTYDRLEYTKACFESLYKTAGYEFDHYVVDNGSTDGTKEWIFDQSEWGDTIYNEKNRGISAASNQAIESIMNGEGVKYDIIGKVDNDCFFLTEGWLAKIVDIWKVNHRIALSPYVQGLKGNPGGAQRLDYGVVKGEYLGLTRHLGGICHFVDASAYRDFRWDEQGFLHGVQDVEFSQYLLLKGFQMGYLENYFVEHYKGTDGQHKDYPEYFERRKAEKTTRYQP